MLSAEIKNWPRNSAVSLVGLPGSGKSTIGRQLAGRLGLNFYDSDAIIERQLGCSIREFFEREGEPAFRRIEQAVIDDLTQKGNFVLATGGGVVLNLANRNALRTRCQTVYLHSPPHEIFRRLRNDRNRPLLQVADPLTRLKDLYAERDHLYRETAALIVETGPPTVSSVVRTIALQIERIGNLPS